MPYLSGKDQPDGLDMYMAHQQGAAGYRSIQSAIAHGEFTRPDTRAKIINNVSSADLKAVTGIDYAAFKRLPDKEMAQAFSQYWDAKFDRIRIPEKGIEAITDKPSLPLSQKTHTLRRNRNRPRSSKAELRLTLLMTSR